MRSRSIVAFGFLLLGVWPAEAQQLKIENVYPRQLPLGRATDVHLVVATLNDLQGAEISPSQGVSISRITREESFQGALTWFRLTLAVAPDAVPGARELVVQLPAGRTAPTILTIPPHVPRISGLRMMSGPNPDIFTMEMTAADDAADLGDAPYVWFMTACGGMPMPGVVRGTVIRQGASTSVRAVIPRPATSQWTCEVHVRVADATGAESNTLTAAVTVGQRAPSGGGERLDVARVGTRPPADGEWVEIVNREDRFAITFPASVAVTDTVWISQFGAALPARTYRADRGARRYSLTVIDYSPTERLLVERSRVCPPGANTCQGIADWGVGYWKTDIRGALLYAVSKFTERDAQVTTLIWNGIALVQGVEMRLTNRADQSRTFASIYLHENRLVIAEATVPRGDSPPVAFNESLNWLDADGRPVRYQSTYVNIPDVPKPLPRGAATAATAAAQR